MRSLKAISALVVLLAATAACAAPAAITGFAGYVKARPAPSTMTGTEVLPLVQSGTTTAWPLSSLSDYVSTRLPALTGAISKPLGSTVTTFGSVTPAGGTAPSLLTDVLGRVLSVTDFGAACDGNTLDQTAIQTAMDTTASLGVTLNLAPKGKTCVVQSLGISTGAKLRIEGTLAGNATNSVLYNKFANGTSSSPETNVAIDGGDIGTIDGRFTSQPVSTACILTKGATQNWTIRGLTLKNCGNWPFNIVGNTTTPKAGAAHMYLSYIKSVGPYSFNTAEFAQGCDDCWLDHYYSENSPPNDHAFSFYANVTNSGITNSRIKGSAIGISVYSDDTSSSPTYAPNSNILIQGNFITGVQGVAVSIASTGSIQRNIRVIGNEGSGNNTANGTPQGSALGAAGLYTSNADNVTSMGNMWHDDGPSSSNSTPVNGIAIDTGTTRFSSIGDAVSNEGRSSGVGGGAVITSGPSQISFANLRVQGDAGTMVYGFNGNCNATCSIVGSKIDTGIPTFASGAFVAGSATLLNNGGGPQYVQGDVNFIGNTQTSGLGIFNANIKINSLGSLGDISQMSVLTPGNAATKPTAGGGGSAMSFASALNAVYGFASKDDTPSATYPYPIFSLQPVASENPAGATHAGTWTHFVDAPGETQRVMAHVRTYEPSTGGSKSVGDLSGERVTDFVSVRGLPGAGSIWANNSVTHLQTGYTGPGAAGAEYDVVNSAQHRGDGFGQVPYTALNSSGISVNTSSTYRNGQAYFVDGKLTDGSPAWNRGFVAYSGSINSNWGCAFCDYGGSYATIQSYGTHTLGLDFTNATPTQGVLGTGVGQGSGISFYENNQPTSRLYGVAGGKIATTGTGFQASTFFETLSTPASSTAACTAGQFTDDANYHYVCTATNKWRRAALSDF